MLSKEYFDVYRNPILKRTWYHGILVGIFMLLAFDNMILIKMVETTIIVLSIVYILQYKTWRVKRVVAFIIAIAGVIIIFLPFNPFYLHIDEIVPYKWYDPYVFTASYWLRDFMAYYGYLTLFSVVAIIITMLYYRYKTKKSVTAIGDDAEEDAVTNIFDAFITGTENKLKKLVTLALLLFIAAFVEEVVYRYILLNLISGVLGFFIPAFIASAIGLFVSAIVFGWAHEGNGFIIYIFNSSLAGIIFGISFATGSLLASFFLHLFWNIMVVVERKIELKLRGID